MTPIVMALTISTFRPLARPLARLRAWPSAL